MHSGYNNDAYDNMGYRKNGYQLCSVKCCGKTCGSFNGGGCDCNVNHKTNKMIKNTKQEALERHMAALQGVSTLDNMQYILQNTPLCGA